MKKKGEKPVFSLSQFEDSPVVLTSSFSESEVVLQALLGGVSSSWLGVDGRGKLTGRELVTELDGREMAQFCERWEDVVSAARLVHSEQLLLAVKLLQTSHISTMTLFSDFYRTELDNGSNSAWLNYIFLNQVSNLALISGNLVIKNLRWGWWFWTN